MEYQVIFGIDGGVSSGLQILNPDYMRKTEKIYGDDSKAAYENAMIMAGKLADNHLINPETGFTTVQLLSLNGPDGAISFEASKAVVKRSRLDHMLTVFSEEKKRTS